jgi:putative SOS response-associated peptidase YedK
MPVHFSCGQAAPKAREALSMCSWYEYDLAEWEVRELVEHYKLTGHNLREPTEVFANGAGVVVVDRGDERALERMLWGLSPWTEGRWLINFRNPEFKPWKSLIENKARRCVVPATRFAGSGRDTGSLPRLRWFARPNRKPFMFAGVWTKWRGDRARTARPMSANTGSIQS